MKVAIVCVILTIGFVNGGLIPATTLIRTPAHDSAIVKSDRFGGNFAYSTVEGHAYAAVSPIVQRVAAISYAPHPLHYGFASAPLISSPVVASPVSYYTPSAVPAYYGLPAYYGNHFVAANPILASNPVFGASFAPVAPQAPSAETPNAPAKEEEPQTPAQGAPADDDTVSVESA